MEINISDITASIILAVFMTGLAIPLLLFLRRLTKELRELNEKQ